MVEDLHRSIQNRMKNPLVIALSVVGKRLRGRDDGDNVNNVQYKSK
jgi:hypothetical protein